MKNIIVPTDFSIKSYNALGLAKRIARRTNGTIHLTHVLEPSHAVMKEYLQNEWDNVYMTKLIEQVSKEMDVSDKAHKSQDVEIITHIKVGSP